MRRAGRELADPTVGTPGIEFLISLVGHLVLVVGIPLLLNVLWRPRVYARPATFQLVRLTTPRSLPSPPRPSAAKQTPKASEPIPATATKKPAPTKPKPIEPSKAQQAQDVENREELSELESLLGGISSPSVDYSAPSDFKYLWYLNAITRKVEQNWRPPLQDPDVFVEVSFTIFRNGTISEVVVTRSSGNAGLDNLAVRAIKLAAPFGELPVGYPESRLDITYRLRPARR